MAGQQYDNSPPPPFFFNIYSVASQPHGFLGRPGCANKQKQLVAILTRDADAGVSHAVEDHLCFRVSCDADVFVCYDAHARKPAPWLRAAGFRATSSRMRTTDGVYALHQRFYAKGSVVRTPFSLSPPPPAVSPCQRFDAKVHVDSATGGRVWREERLLGCSGQALSPRVLWEGEGGRPCQDARLVGGGLGPILDKNKQ